jgi:hypothetical protein
MTTAALREAMEIIILSGQDPTELQWFDISAAVNDQTNAGTIEQLMHYRPPFQKNMVVWRGQTKSHEQYDLLMLIAGDDPEEGITIAAWKGPYGHRPRSLPMMVYLVDGDVVRYGPVDENAQLSEDDAKLMLAMIGAWYRQLDAGTHSHQPYVKPTFTNKRKIAAGKTPTYDWHTVVIGVKSGQRVNGAGSTHATPREHDRRGHIRRLRSGKNVWVKACKVGAPELGAVFKDYQVAMPNVANA